MGEHEGWAEPPGGLLPSGLLPNEAASVIRVLDSERWSKAEERTAELIGCIQPTTPSEERRNAVTDYVQRLIMKCFPSQVKVVTFGSVPLKTYLPDGDIDLTAFSENQNLKETWAHQVRDMLENEEKNENAEFRVKEVQYIQAEVKIIKCLVENIVVDISFDQLGGLCTLCFLLEVDHLINQNHLFKRSIILIKAWCYYESRILGAHHGLISTYALETLVLYIFHVFNNSFAGPLEVLYRFLEFFSKFDWENFCVSLWGPVPISSLPDVTAEPPRKDGGQLLLSKLFLDACSKVYAVFPGGQENQGQSFVSKHFNVIDPLRINNNLGRSVSKGNFFRIRSAFAFGAKRLARLLDCPKEDLYFEVNQFFMNTWDRHGSGRRPDAPSSDLWRLRLSNPDHHHGSENLRIDSSSIKDEVSSSRNVSSQHRIYNYNDTPPVSHTQSPKIYGTMNNSADLNQYARNDKGKKSSKPGNSVNDNQGKFLFARTRSSPELTDTYGESSFQGTHSRIPESGKSQNVSARLDDSRKKNLEADVVANTDGRSATEDPSSVRHLSSRQVRHSVANSNCDDSGLSAMGEEFASALGTQGMHQEEQDLVNIMASSTGHFSGQLHMPLNLASGHMPLPIPPSVLASMGYAHRMVPTNIPLLDNPWGAHMQFPHGLMPSQLTHYFPGIGLNSNPGDSIEPCSEHFGPGEVNPGEANRGYWNEQVSGSSGRFEHNNGIVEALHSDDNKQSISAGYNSVSSSRASSSGNHARVQQKFTRENRVSPKEDHLETSLYQDIGGNESYFDDKTASSRPASAAHATSLRSKTSSESSWEGLSAPSAKASTTGKEKQGRKIVPSTCGKTRSVSEHSSTQADDDNRDWNQLPTTGNEVSEGNMVPESVASLRHQVHGFEQAQTSGSDSLIPIAPMLLGPGSRQRATDSSGVAPFTFYPTGPPVPFVTMLPFYHYQTDAGAPDALSNHLNGEEQLDSSDSGQNFNQVEGPDRSDVVSTSVRSAASIEPLEHKPDILHSDFASHWQNLQYGRFCQNSCSPAPMLYPSPVAVPPVYLQGHFPWDGPGRPLTANMNLFSQLMNYGPRLVPAAPPQTVSDRPATVYQRYVDEMPRYRSGTGTYLPNPKVPARDRYSSGNRRGNYNYDRIDHQSEREGNWTNSKGRGGGRGRNRSQAEKQSSRLAANGSRSDRPWGTHRHESYQSQNGPVRTNPTQSSSGNMAYTMYPVPGMNPGVVSSELPSVVMLYPYDQNSGYGKQLEFGSLELQQGSQLHGVVFEEQRFQNSGSAQISSPDEPSSPHVHHQR